MTVDFRLMAPAREHSTRANGAVALVTHSYYEEDPRVRRQAEALAAAGHAVDVFGLRRPDDATSGDLGGVRIRRLDVQRHQGAGLATYLAEYLSFLVRAAFALAAAHPRRRYRLVQVATLPDFLVFAALPHRMAGIPVVLDLHEAMPEFFRSRFPRVASGLLHGLLLAQERLSIAAASHVLTVNDALRDRLIRLGVTPDHVSVVPNSPSLALFDPLAHPVRRFAEDGVVRLVYAGALTPTYELEVVLEALRILTADRSDLAVRLDLYGRGDSAGPLLERVRQAGLGDRVSFHGRVPIETVPAAVAAADIGLAPTRRDAFTDVSLSTKIFEYGAMGKPIVASRLPLVEATFPPGTVATYAPGDARDLADAILRVATEGEAREAAVRRTLEFVRSASWERESVRYVALIRALARQGRARR